MSDACIVCECEAVDTSDWFYCRKIAEYVCPWCIKEMWQIRDRRSKANEMD